MKKLDLIFRYYLNDRKTLFENILDLYHENFGLPIDYTIPEGTVLSITIECPESKKGEK